MNKKFLMVLIVVVLVGAVGAGVYFFFLSGDKEWDGTLYPWAPSEFFVTNVKDSNYLFKTSVTLMLDNEKVAASLSDKEIVIRDAVIFLLRDLTREDINSDGIRIRLEAQLIEALNAELGITNIRKVYFGDFVMQ